jgi:catechol 2,3-dioxygenase-like lactoylglutathione lyase family enzyme
MPVRNQLNRATFLAITLVLFFFGVFFTTFAPAAEPPGQKERMYLVKVTHVCIITPQFAKMQDFYKRILHLEPKQFQVDYVEFQTPGAIISLYDEASFVQTVPGFKPRPGTGGAMLELQVANVDQEFTRLHSIGLKIDFLMPPTTFPWGNRSTYLRDPDGNLINLYTPVSAPSQNN